MTDPLRRRVRVALVGAGHLGSYHLDKLVSLPHAQLTAIVEPHSGRLADAVKRAKQQNRAVPYAVESLAALGDVPIDAAIIACPTEFHEQLGMQCLQRGWHVLLEKPLAATSAAATHLVIAARQAGLILQVGHVERFNPAIQAALAVVEDPRFIHCERLGPFSGRSPETDVILDLMVHDLDLVLAVVPAEPVDVRAIGVAVLTRAIDMASVRIEFANGAVAQLSAGRASFEPCRKVRFFTPERYVSVDCIKREVKCARSISKDLGRPWAALSTEAIQVPESDPLGCQDADFLDAIIQGRQPRVSGEDGLRTLLLAERILVAIADNGQRYNQARQDCKAADLVTVQ